MKAEDKKKLLDEIDSCIDWKESDHKLLGRKVFFKNLSPEEKNRALIAALDASGNSVDSLLENEEQEVESSKEIKKEDVEKELKKDSKNQQGFENPAVFEMAMKLYVGIESVHLKINGEKEKAFDYQDYETLKKSSESSKVWDIVKEASEYNENDLKKK